MVERFFPLGAGRVVTSPFGPRAGGFHYGVDFGRVGGSANMPVYAIQSGVVIYAGAAQGYGGSHARNNDPCCLRRSCLSRAVGSTIMQYKCKHYHDLHIFFFVFPLVPLHTSCNILFHCSKNAELSCELCCLPVECLGGVLGNMW